MEKTPTHTDSKMETTEPEFSSDFYLMYPDYWDSSSSFIMPSRTMFQEHTPVVIIRETSDDYEAEISSMKNVCDELKFILDGLEAYELEKRRNECSDATSRYNKARRFYYAFRKAKTYMEELDNIVGVEEPRNIVIQRRIYLIETLATKMRDEECSLSKLGFAFDNIRVIGSVLRTIPDQINKQLKECLKSEEFWKTDFEKE